MLLLLIGCAPEPGPSVVEGLRGGVGYWPENSRTAVEGAIEAGIDGVQLDLVLTDDRIPVLVRGPYLEPNRCTRADGAPLESRVLVRSLPLEDLVEGYRCGGVPDPDHPNALVVPEPVLTLDELVELLHAGPYLSVHLAIHQDKPLTGPPDVFATAVVDRWLAADLPNDLWISSPDPVVLAAFEDRARIAGADLVALRTWPAPGAGGAQDLLQAEAERSANGLDYVDLVEQVGADGLLLDGSLADPWLLRSARRQGVPTWVVVDALDPRPLQIWGNAPVEGLITAYPGDLP
jgi:glycerophosphoryl diester phosphodiesterase